MTKPNETDDALGQGSFSPEDLRQKVEESFFEFEESFRMRHPLVWLMTLVGPFVVTIAVLCLVGFLIDFGFARKIVLNAAATFVIFGRFVIILGGQEANLGQLKLSLLEPWQLMCVVTYMDSMVAMLVAFHIGFLFKIPVLGPKIRELVADGNFILSSHPWMRRATMAGLITFVAFPLSTTGSIGGSIFGRLLGLSRGLTLLGILCGSLIGNGVMLALAGILEPYMDHPVVRYGGFVVIIVVIIFLNRRYSMMKKEFLKSR